MRLSEISSDPTGWETVRPKIGRALSAISKKLGAEFAPNKSGFRMKEDLGQGRKLGWPNAGWLGVYLYVDFRQNGAFGGNKIHAGVSVSVMGETVRMTSDGGMDGERDVPVWSKELDPNAPAEEILAMFEELKSHIAEGVETMRDEVAKLKAGPSKS